ncbi:MAG: glycosyltransferase family 2 protein [Acidimicrobiia bacterium]|nr:glycosyltransferase family 2 protein [Acidimicrobiia bacterium]MYE72223.1 glycosyltransferase family 2 protein [Acidimicrobiia bacterium]MYJ61064.1 glycosyltransferase family 2 protein [Acidimicrobiia bacterium]
MEAKADFRIHVVIVSHDPGLWFDESLESIAAQDLPLVDVTVVDAASESDTTARVHRFLPQAVVHRLDSNPGFGPAANQVLADADPAPDFFVFCHDDVALAPNALRLLANEAVRSNAGIVGPKYVDWDDPSRILQVGLMVDKTGISNPSVEAGELDQEQHDVVQEMFAVPGGCVLVRGDLFRAVGGFDPEMSFCYEHVDLCWRARTVGARVMVAPTAVVRHRQRLADRVSQTQIEGLVRRHRVRTLLSVYGAWHSVRVIPQAMVLSAFELLAAMATGHLHKARQIGASWGYNLVRLGSIRRRRQAVGQSRHVGDSHIRLSQARGLAPLVSFLTSWRNSAGEGVSTRSTLMARLSRSRAPLLVGIATVILVLLGARELVAGSIPAVGDMARLGSSSDLLSNWWSDSRPVGLGQEGFAPTGLGVLTLLSWLFLGQTDLLRTVLIVGMVPLGALGLWRLMRPFDSLWIQGVALAVYLANPVPYNALANGAWSALLMYGAVPWLLRAVLAGSCLAPYGKVGGSPGPGLRPPSFVREALAVGLLFGLAGALASEALIVMGLLLAGLILGSLIAGTAKGLTRMAAVVVAGAAVAAVLNLPWLADSLPTLLGDRPGGNGGNSWAEILRFDTGPFGDNRLGWALPVAAVLPLALAHDSRLAWAVRGWTLYLGTAAVALVAEQDWSPVPLPRPEVIQVPGAVGLAIAVSMGVAAFLVDIRRHRFGWRQVVPFTAVAALVAGMLPALAVVSGGDWNATRDDYSDVAPFSDDGEVAEHRVLWLGHPDVMPLASWNLDGHLSFAISDGKEFPSVAQRWVGRLDDRTSQVADAVLQAPESGTSRLGAELSQWGIGTILVPERLAPPPYGELSQSAPEWLLDMLDSQLDLVPGGLTSGIPTYHNTAAGPEDLRAAIGPPPDDGNSDLNRLLLSVQIALWVVGLVGIARLSTGDKRRRLDIPDLADERPAR